MRKLINRFPKARLSRFILRREELNREHNLACFGLGSRVHSEAGYRYGVDFDGILGLTSKIGASLTEFFDRQAPYLKEIGSELEPVAESKRRMKAVERFWRK